jgi:hypothetical protein
MKLKEFFDDEKTDRCERLISSLEYCSNYEYKNFVSDADMYQVINLDEQFKIFSIQIFVVFGERSIL